ncbi:hypothetical protein CAter282_2629 [Collimonas arenae]|uniref:Uncharacterized protein n=2 Tax=Collimonas arenae TaxID=279058 RepID=A0A127QL94_9BURK|nr:hypothetical protein [Collimonas arenae]AMP10362.1 hypothetical protein CAter282_2629 [Collimonas arenae]
MMAGKFVIALALSLGLTSGLALADGDTAATAPAAVNLFAKPLDLRGTLGDAKIEMHLQLKPDPTEGIQGTYVIAGQSGKILLAGESENTDVIMEESVNGKDVSGEWAGTLVGNTFSGTWSTTDDAVTKPFVLVVQHLAQTARSGK